MDLELTRSPCTSQTSRVEEVGIGIGLALDEERNLVISNLIPGSPALRSGLLEIGDALRHVDGRDVRGMSPEQASLSSLLSSNFPFPDPLPQPHFHAFQNQPQRRSPKV